MLRLVIRRLALSVPVLFLVSLLAFVLIQLTPGDPARLVAGDGASKEQVALVRHELGLDKPLVEQYGSFVHKAVTLNFGTSIQDARPVGSIIRETLPVTLSLGLVALVMSLLIAVPAGFVAALWKGRWPDRVITAAAALWLAVPPFVIALVLVVPLAVHRTWFPATGYTAFADSPWEWLRNLLLPGFTLALVSAAELIRQIRGALIDAFEHDFIRASRAKGLREWLVIGKHAARSAAPPAVTVFGLQIGRVLGGAVVVEFVYALPGFGSLALNAVTTHDFPLIQGIVLVSALFVIVSNLLVDVACGYLNPKLRT